MGGIHYEALFSFRNLEEGFPLQEYLPGPPFRKILRIAKKGAGIQVYFCTVGEYHLEFLPIGHPERIKGGFGSCLDFWLLVYKFAALKDQSRFNERFGLYLFQSFYATIVQLKAHHVGRDLIGNRTVVVEYYGK